MQTLDARTYPAGKTDLPAVAIPDGPKAVVFYIDRTALTDATAEFDFQVECSFDGGTKWQSWVGCTFPGGQLFDKDGKEVTFSSLTTACDIPAVIENVVTLVPEMIDIGFGESNPTGRMIERLEPVVVEWVRPTHVRCSLTSAKANQSTSCKVDFV